MIFVIINIGRKLPRIRGELFKILQKSKKNYNLKKDKNKKRNY